MSFSAAQELKDRVRQATDIVDLIGSQISLRRQGRHYVGLCPWHDDARPSLQVNSERQSWKCWVCNLGGDVFSFMMQREGVDFPTALTMLAERAGIEPRPEHAGKAALAGGPGDKQTLFRAMAWAEEQYHNCLLRDAAAEPARDYLRGRQIDQESIRRYRLGYAPDNRHWLLDRARSAGIAPEVLEAVGLVAQGERGTRYERFRGRVLFPIRDTQSRSVALGGRILPQLSGERVAKYINSPETRLFSKSEQLYGLDVVREAVVRGRQVVVMEGYTDVVMARQFGLDNVVAVLGTALGTRHLSVLRRFADRVTLVLDGDEAGQRRTNEVLELFIAGQLDLRVVTLPERLDPCDFLLQRGADAFGAFLAGAVDALEHKLHGVLRNVDPMRDTHRAHAALEEVLGVMAKAPRLQTATPMSLRLREQQMLPRLAREFGVAEAELRERLRALRGKAPAAAAAAEPARPIPAARTAELDPWERELFEILTQQTEAWGPVAQQLDEDQFSTPAGRALLAAYRRAAADHGRVDFDLVMDALEEPALKSLLVELDEQGSCKQVQPEVRLRDLIASFTRRRLERQGRDAEHQLRQHHCELNEEQAVDLLRQLIDVQRNRQGIAAPTDG